MSKKLTYTLLAFLSGVATGAAFGVLYAPDKGQGTRNRLSYQLDKYRDMLMDLTNTLRESRETPQSSARSEGQRVIQDAKDKAEKLLGDVDLLINQINSRRELL